jgi:ribosomal protein S18 acetylase RimI-like enzyme
MNSDQPVDLNKPGIRRYVKADFPSVVDLLRLNTPEYFSPTEEVDLNNYLLYEVEFFYVSVLENRIVGCGGINLSADRKKARISWDIIHPEFQRKGIGGQLLKHRMKVISSMQEVKEVEVRTSQLAWRFYERNGFVLQEVLRDYWAKGYDLYRMVFVPES